MEGGFAGFSADYLTKSPSRDRITLPIETVLPQLPGSGQKSLLGGWVRYY